MLLQYKNPRKWQLSHNFTLSIIQQHRKDNISKLYQGRYCPTVYTVAYEGQAFLLMYGRVLEPVC